MAHQKLDCPSFDNLPIIEPVKVFEAYSEKRLFGLVTTGYGPSGENWDLAIAPDERTFLLASASWVFKWNIDTGKIVGWMEEHKVSDTRCAAISKTGLYALTGGYDGCVVYWDYLEAKKIHRFEGLNGGLPMALEFSKNEELAISVTKTGRIIVLDLKNRHMNKPIEAGEDLHDIHVCSDGNHFLTVSISSELRKWDLRSMTTLFQGVGSTGAARGGWGIDMAVSRDEKIAITCGQGGFVVWDIEQLKPIEEVEFYSNPAVAISDNKSFFMVASNDYVGNDLIIWDFNSFKPKYRLRGHKGAVNAVKVSSSGRFALSTGQDNRVLMWDLQHLRV